MTNEKTPERIWIVDQKHGFTSRISTAPIENAAEYVHADLLATIRKEEREAAIDAVRACSTRDELHPDISITVSEFKERVIGLLEAGLAEK